MEKNVIEVKNVKKSFKTYEARESASLVSKLLRREYTKVALSGVSFSIKEGDIVALLGKNGSGKSTLIKILSGILYPDSGDVRVLGLNPWYERMKLAAQIGVVLGAHGQLFWNLPALDTFTLMKHVYHIPDAAFNQRLEYLLGLLDLKDVYKRQVRTLSLGEQMKCNFVSSVLHMPRLIILDEPTIGVDLPSKQALRSAILEMRHDHNTTFLLTTHIVEDISMADRIIVLDRGKKVYDGSRRKLETLFGDKKVIEIQFKKAGDHESYAKYGNITEVEGNYIKLEVKPQLLKNKKFMQLLSGRGVEDFSVTEPGLGNVLMKLYKMEKDAGE